MINRKLKRFTILIDTEDLQRLIDADLGWHVRYDKYTKDYYARTIKTYYVDGIKNVDTILLQKFLLRDAKVEENEYIHHKNHNTLDNRKENLEIITMVKNTRHRKGKNSNNVSGYRNVTYLPYRKKTPYHVQLTIDGKNQVLGKFSDVDEAGRFAEEMRQKYYGKYAGAS